MISIPTKSSKCILLTHGNCPDGSAAAVVAQHMAPQTQIVYGLHKAINQQALDAARELGNGDFLWIADICCDEDVLTYLLHMAGENDFFVGVFEHHKTRDWLKDFKAPAGVKHHIEFDQDRCGSKVFYDAHKPLVDSLSIFEDFVTVTNDRDLWLNNDARGVRLAKLHFILGNEKFLKRFLKNPVLTFDSNEEALLLYVEEKEKKRIERILKKMTFSQNSDGYKFAYAYDTGESSDVLNEAIERFDLEYAILIDLNNGKGSIRGRGNVDCSLYAQERGGGGHPCASGFLVPVEYPKL